MSSPISLTAKLQFALNQQILSVKCAEICQILSEVSNKDIVYVLRTIVENIFAVDGNSGWGLRVLSFSQNQVDFQQLRSFLSPTGPLISFTYKLAQEALLPFEFPVAWLPVRVRHEIEDGTVDAFYTNRLQPVGPGKPNASIVLNAFEFYMFNFVYFLVNPSYQRAPFNWSSVGEAIYPTLLEDYLVAYLPCDASTPPGPSSQLGSPRGVFSPMVPRMNMSSGLNLTNIVSPISSHTLWLPAHTSYFEGVGGNHTSSPIHSQITHVHQQQGVTWTSQAFLQIIFEMWVKQSNPSVRSPVRHISASFTPAPVSSSSFGDLFVPSSDQVRIIRMMIKHLHYFVNSFKPAQSSLLDELRKNLWTLCRKPFYQFLQHVFTHWPLDSSFRLVLETWLSYIQPWRYISYSKSGSRSPVISDMEIEVTHAVDPKWQSFVSENLLFYSVFFHQLLDRLLRLDLVSPRNAQILFRVSKVFSQGNLSAYIAEIEESLKAGIHHRSFGPHSPPHSPVYNPQSPPHLPHLGDTTHSSQSLAALALSQIKELEGHHHNYVPLFGLRNIEKVTHLLGLINSARIALLKELEMSGSRGNLVFFKNASWFPNVLQGLLDLTHCKVDENGVEEIKKTLIHLETSQRQLCAVFNLMAPLSFDSCDSLPPHQSDEASRSAPPMVATSDGLVLSDLGRQQLLRGFRRFDLKYEGDPDLRPICTYELAFLVRWLHRLSNCINTKYKSDMIALYYRDDILGTIMRAFLQTPRTVYEYQKGHSSAVSHQRVAKNLPPRVSLRMFATKQLVYTLLLFFLLIQLFGISTVSCFNMLVPFMLIYMLWNNFSMKQSNASAVTAESNNSLSRDQSRH